MSETVGPDWVELRVHGVSGTPPEAMLASAHVCQVAGDDRSRFFRPTDAQGHEVPGDDGQVLEAFHWGRWTSGSWIQALWILLIPFGIVNAAQFMLSAPASAGARRYHAVSGAVLRLLALVLTCLLAVGACVAVIDLVAWQWLTRMELPGDDRVIMVGAVVVTTVLVYLIARLGRGSGARRSWPTGAEADGLPGMRDPAFFDGDRDSPALRHLHRAGPLYLIAWLGVSVVVESREGLATLGRWAPVVGLLVTVLVVVLLGDPERSTSVATGDGGLRRWWHGIPAPGQPAPIVSPAEQVAGWLHVVGLVMVLGAAAAIGFAPVDEGGALSGVDGHLPGIEEVAAWVGIGGTLALLLLGGAVQGLARLTRGADEVLPEPFRRFAGGKTAWLASAIGFFLGIGLTAGLALTVQGLLNRARGEQQPVQAPDILQRVSFTWGVTAGVLVLLAVAAWVYLRRRRRAFAGAATAAFTFGDDPRPRLVAVWLGRVGSAMQLARLKNHVPLVFWIFGVLGVWLALAAATDHLVERFTDDAEGPLLTLFDWFTGTSSLAGAPIVGDDIVIGVGQVTLLGLAGGAVLLARGAIRAEGPRRALNVIWDVIAYWPRSVHPFVPPPYAQEVVPALVRRICWHLGVDDPLPDTTAPAPRRVGNPAPVGTVVVAAHSQGSLVSLAALLRLPEEVRSRVRWLTCGSQLRQQFPRAFPHYVRVADLEEMLATHGWLSLYRDTDPIAGPVTSWAHGCGEQGRPISCRLSAGPTPVADQVDTVTGRRICGREWRLLDPPVSDWRFQTSAVPGLRGHSDYWLDPDWRAALADVRAWTPPSGPDQQRHCQPGEEAADGHPGGVGDHPLAGEQVAPGPRGELQRGVAPPGPRQPQR